MDTPYTVPTSRRHAYLQQQKIRQKKREKQKSLITEWVIELKISLYQICLRFEDYIDEEEMEVD